VDRRPAGPELRPERVRTARTAASVHAPDRSTSTHDRYVAGRPPPPGRVLATAGKSPRRRDDDPEQLRHNREGPSPSRGPPHQTLRWVLGRAREPRPSPVRASYKGRMDRAGRSTSAVAACVHGASPLCEPGDPSARSGPSLDYRPYPSRDAWAVQGVEQALYGRSGTLGHDLDPPVVQVRCPADQSQFEGPCPHPPSKSDTLYMPVHPRRQSDIGRFLSGHGEGRFTSGLAALLGLRCSGAAPLSAHGHQRPLRGRGWQRGQLNDERFMNWSRRIGVPQRGQGSCCRP
jgi:hypothetical protein